MAKMTDRELNAKLMETLNITSTDAKRAFEELMNEKVSNIRQEVRQEVYEEFSKQARIDKENIVNSMNQLTTKVINEEMKKIDLHRKNLIKEKMECKNRTAETDKILSDRTAIIKENYNKKLRAAIANMEENIAEQKASFVQKASSFINESIKREVSELHNDKKQLGDALSKFSKFVSEQVATQTQSHREELKSLDSLRVRLVKENSEKLAKSKKEFFAEAANRMEKFINSSVKRELNEFREQIAESRRKSFGAKLFEAFSREFATKFFNEDKVVKSLVESLKANQNKLMQTTKVLETEKANLLKENQNLKLISNKLSREKIINESVAHLAKDKQDMIKNLIKEVPTEKLNESIKKYIPMILSNPANKSINTNERVLRESRKTQFLTGENKKQTAMSLNNDLDSDLDAEINKAIAIGKF